MQLKKIILWLLPWYPVLQFYFIGSLSLAFYVYTPLLFVLFIQKKHLKIDKSLLVLYLVTVFIQIAQIFLPYISFSVTWHNMVMYTFYLLSIICVSNYVSLKEFMKPYTATCLVFIIGMFFQAFQLYALHIPVTGPITLFPSLLGEKNVSLGDDLIRPMSFFQEPQAFATYIVIFIIIMLEEKNYAMAALASLSVLLSTSTEGLALTAIVWVLYVVFSKTRPITKGLILVGLVLVAGWYMSAEYFSVGLDKAINQDYESNARLVNGFLILGNMDLRGFVWGMGTAANYFFNQMGALIGQVDDENVVYFTTATGVFITYGIFVGIAYWVCLLKKIRLNHKSLFTFGLCLCIIPFAQTCLWSPAFVYMLSYYYLLENHCETKERVSSLPTKIQNGSLNNIVI